MGEDNNPKVEIITPKNGAKFNVGDKMNISWAASNIPAGSKLTLRISNHAIYRGPNAAQVGDSPYFIIDEFKLPADATSFVWIARLHKFGNAGEDHEIEVKFSDSKDYGVAYAIVRVAIWEKLGVKKPFWKKLFSK